MKDIYGQLEGMDKFQFHETPTTDKPLLEGAKNLRAALDESSTDPLDTHIARGNLKDQLLYIYTSGTTGLPKAATITNVRYNIRDLVPIYVHFYNFIFFVVTDLC